MNTTLFPSIAKQLTPQMVQHVSQFLNETPARTQQAIDQAIPTLLAGLMHFSSVSQGPAHLFTLITHDNYSRLLNNLSGLCDEGNTTHNVITAGQEILRVVFADKRDAVRELIAGASGVSSASAASLLSLTAPVVAGVLARTRATQGLDATGLAKVLLDQKYFLSRQAPAGLAEIFGVKYLAHLGAEGAGGETARTPDSGQRVTTAPPTDKRTWKHWRWPALGFLAVGVVCFLVGRGPGRTQSLMVNWTPKAAPAVASRTLSGGATLPRQGGSFTTTLATFLGDAAMTTLPQTFVIDGVTFDAGTAQLTPASRLAVNTLLVLLRTYPTTDVQVDGYTDNIGDAAENKKLSGDRAAAVQAVLLRGGISAARVTTAGYGQEHPRASNETAAGRAANQRLELVVLKK